jgi:hypothetical protein
MSDYYPPSSATQSTYEETRAMPASEQSTMTDKATEAASEGKQAAGQVAQSAVEQAHEVKDEAVRQARDLAGEARQQLSSQVGEQHKALVTNLRSLSSELGAMTRSTDEQSGVATELVGQAKDRVNGLADWLDGREPGQLLDEARRFARQRPGMFLLGALTAGVVAGRLTRGVVASHSSDDASAPGDSGAQQGLPAYGATAEPGAATGYSSGGQYGQPGAEVQPEYSQGYGSTSTYGDNAGSEYGAPAYGHPQPVPRTQDLPNGGTWR